MIWQAPVEGDRSMDELEPRCFAKDLVAGFDVPAELAEDMVSRVDGPMKDSRLGLYRSALTTGAEWEPALADIRAGPGVPGDSRPACQFESGEKLGRAVRASRVLRLDCNHWTVLQKPAEVAAVLAAPLSGTTGFAGQLRPVVHRACHRPEHGPVYYPKGANRT